MIYALMLLSYSDYTICLWWPMLSDVTWWWFLPFLTTHLAAVVSVGAALFLFQQLAGINAVVYYSTSVFRSAGIKSDVAASAFVGAANVFGNYSIFLRFLCNFLFHILHKYLGCPFAIMQELPLHPLWWTDKAEKVF